jgi:hypothetical protein
MANHKLLAWSLLFVMLIVSCVKDPQDIPSGLTDDPVFGLSGVFGNQSINIDAGRDGWTVQPFTEQADSNIAYSTIFSLDKCIQDCAPSYRFKIFRAWPADADPAKGFLQTIVPGDIELVPSEEERAGFHISLSTHPGLFMSGYSYWEDLNGPVTFLDSYTSTLGYNEKLNVCFESLAFTGCTYSQCIFFEPSTLIPCLAYIEAGLENFRYLRLTVRPQGTPPFTFDWSDGFHSSSILMPVQDSLSEVFASVTVTDANGNRTALNQTIRIQNGIVDACYFPIELESQPIFDHSPFLTGGKMEISYSDADGETWSSSAGIQDPGSYISIAQVDNYGLSPLDQQTYKAVISLSVQLYNQSTGEARNLVLQNASIPFSHP